MNRQIVGLACAAALGAIVVMPLRHDAAGRLAADEPVKNEPAKDASTTKEYAPMQLGNFSVSLSVKDIAASRAFYEKLGFKVVGGKQEQNWLVLQNDTSTIGLFQGMFEKNTLTYNPGWTRDSKPHDEAAGPFTDVRELQKELKARGVTLTAATDEAGTGPAYIVLTDPDGNPILIDQHVPAPKK